MKRLNLFAWSLIAICFVGCKNTSVPQLTMAEQMDLPNDVKEVSYHFYKENYCYIDSTNNNLEEEVTYHYSFWDNGKIDRIVITDNVSGIVWGHYQYIYDRGRLVNVEPHVPLGFHDQRSYVPEYEEHILDRLLHRNLLPFNPIESEGETVKVKMTNGEYSIAENKQGLYYFTEENSELILDPTLQLQGLFTKTAEKVDTLFARSYHDGKLIEVKDNLINRLHDTYTYNEKGLVGTISEINNWVHNFKYQYDDKGYWNELVIENYSKTDKQIHSTNNIKREIEYGTPPSTQMNTLPIIDGDWMTVVDEKANEGRAIITMENVDFSKKDTKTYGKLIWKVQLEGGLPLTFGVWDFVYYLQINENTAIVGIRDRDKKGGYCSQMATMKREGDDITLSNFVNYKSPETEKDTYMKFPYESITF